MYQSIAIDSIIPVRKDLSETSEMVTQILFGEQYTVIETQNNWVKIKSNLDSYEGYIDSKMIATKIINEKNDFQKYITTSIISEIIDLSNNTKKYIVSGSSLPYMDGNHFNIGTHKYFFSQGENKLFKTETRDYIIETAEKFLNSPYLWGGRTPFGIDCSGFTQIVFKIAGFYLSRDASEQINQGTIVEKLSHAQAGDLLFFENEENKISHVGIYLGNQEIIHASGRVKIEKIDDQGIINASENTYSHKLNLIKNIIG